MNTSISATQLPSQIQSLLKLRDQHTTVVGQIDKTLAAVIAALGGPESKAVRGAARSPAAKPLGAGKPKRRTTFSVSASELVLEFVNANQNPATQEIMQHLASQGRAGGMPASTQLSK